MSDDQHPLPNFEHAPVTQAGEPGHLVNDYRRCPVDPSHEGFDVRNYDQRFRDGDVHCAQCGAYIRTYDAG